MRIGLNLEDYPQVIAQTEREILELNCDREQIESQINLILISINSKIAADTTLENEQQRKSKREELTHENEKLSQYKVSLARTQIKIESKKIELNQLRNEFTVLK